MTLTSARHLLDCAHRTTALERMTCLEADLGQFDRRDRHAVAVVVTTDGRRVHMPIDPNGLAAWQADSKRVPPVLLDARTLDEYAVSHLRGALRMDPYRPLLRPLRGMPKDTAIVVYSTVGYRGARLVHWLTAQGYGNATALSGSIFAWANEGRPLEREGRPVTQVHPYDDSWKYLLASDYRIQVPPVEKKSAAP